MTHGVSEMGEAEFLRAYVASRSDEAFKALIDQYVGLIYAACYRQLKDRHLAEDATQAVFLLLSQKAGALRPAHLAGWLLTTSRYACANIRRTEQRRQRREQVVAMNENTSTETKDDDLLNLLDEALCHLKASDREALVLRFQKDQPLTDIAATLGISEAAARKRIGRGIERLRSYFSRRGITVASAALGVVLTEQVRGASLTPIARQSLAQGILQVYHAGSHCSAASVAIAKGTKSMMRISKLKSAALVLLVAAAMGTSGWIISRAMAQKAPSAEVGGAAPAPQPTPTAPAKAQAATPTTETSIDLSTPENTLTSFFTALGEGDRDTAYECLTADPKRTPTLMDAVLALNVAQNHLTHAAVQTFGGDGAPFQQMTTLDSVAQVVGEAPPAQVNGDAATIFITIPQTFIDYAPAKYRGFLLAWANTTFYFKKQADSWKFDIDRSMRVTIKLRSKTKPITDPAVQLGFMMDQAQILETLAGDILGGKYAAQKDALHALSIASAQMHNKYGGIVSVQMKVLPAQIAK